MTGRTSSPHRHRRVAAALGVALIAAIAGVAAGASSAAVLEQRLIAADGADGDFFGDSLAVDGDTAVVGAPQANTAGGGFGSQGAVYVFQRSGGAWQQVAKLTASDGRIGDKLGTSVAIDGDVIVAGAPYAYIGEPRPGVVYTFARTGAADRTETAKLTASDGASDDQLGYSVAIDGDTIVAGANGDDSSRGSAYTFVDSGGGWSQTAKLIASDGAAGNELGASVAIDGDLIVAGAHYADIGATSYQGAAYTFARTGAADRTETAKLTASDGEAGDELGYSVAIDGDTIVAGAPFAAGGSSTGYLGAVYTFPRTGGDSTQTAELTSTDNAGNNDLGISVAIDGDLIVAGADYATIGANSDQGAAYTFARTGGNWARTGKLTASDGEAGDQLGISVAIGLDTILAGAFEDHVGANAAQGSATVFTLLPPAPAPPAPAPPEAGLIPGGPITLKAKSKTIVAGAKVKLIATVTPCGKGPDPVALYEGNKQVRAATAAGAPVVFKLRLKKSARFEVRMADQPSHGHTGALSNRVKVKVTGAAPGSR